VPSCPALCDQSAADASAAIKLAVRVLKLVVPEVGGSRDGPRCAVDYVSSGMCRWIEEEASETIALPTDLANDIMREGEVCVGDIQSKSRVGRAEFGERE
jgi:hypothetical protein